MSERGGERGKEQRRWEVAILPKISGSYDSFYACKTGGQTGARSRKRSTEEEEEEKGEEEEGEKEEKKEKKKKKKKKKK